MNADRQKRVPVTRDEWMLMGPREQGYCTYMYSEWPGSTVPKDNPYMAGMIPHNEFQAGEMAGVLEAQDSDD